MGNFGAPPMPPWTGSTARSSPSATRVRSSGDERAAGAGRGEFCEVSCELGAVLLHRLATRPPGGGHQFQHLPERWTAPARLGRPVGAAVHRPAVRVEEHGQGPAALFAHRVQRGHVDVVDVRPLLAIDFHVDEQLVHPVGGLGVLEQLVRHHMAPVAGGVADRDEDRTVAPLRFRQRLLAPRAPVDGVVRVLQQIGRGRVVEEVAAGLHPHSPSCRRGRSTAARPRLEARMSGGDQRQGTPVTPTRSPAQARGTIAATAPAPLSA